MVSVTKQTFSSRPKVVSINGVPKVDILVIVHANRRIGEQNKKETVMFDDIIRDQEPMEMPKVPEMR